MAENNNLENITYRVKNQEQLSRLESAMNLLFENFQLGENTQVLEVEFSATGVRVTPSPYTALEKIFARPEKSTGRITYASNEGVGVRIGETSYSIKYSQRKI